MTPCYFTPFLYYPISCIRGGWMCKFLNPLAYQSPPVNESSWSRRWSLTALCHLLWWVWSEIVQVRSGARFIFCHYYFWNKRVLCASGLYDFDDAVLLYAIFDLNIVVVGEGNERLKMQLRGEAMYHLMFIRCLDSRRASRLLYFHSPLSQWKYTRPEKRILTFI